MLPSQLSQVKDSHMRASLLLNPLLRNSDHAQVGVVSGTSNQGFSLQVQNSKALRVPHIAILVAMHLSPLDF